MIEEHDCVVLTNDLPSEGLLSGDVGTVVHIHRNVSAYEVEFATLTGKTIAVAAAADQSDQAPGRLSESGILQ